MSNLLQVIPMSIHQAGLLPDWQISARLWDSQRDERVKGQAEKIRGILQKKGGYL